MTSIAANHHDSDQTYPPAIAFAPGVFCTPDLFAHQAAALSEKNWDVRYLDTTQDDSLSAMASRFLKNAPEKFVLVGLSMGGYLALEVVRQAQERILALVLMDTTARPDDEARLMERDAECSRVESGDFDAVKAEIDVIIVGERSRADPKIMAIVKKMSSDIGPKAFVQQSIACGARIDSRDSLPEIRVPTLALVGIDDDLTPLELHKEIVALVPESELAVIKNSGHLPTIENPEDTTRVLLDFLDRKVMKVQTK